MYKVIDNKEIIPNVFILEVECPLIAKKIEPGEFVIIMTKQRSERIPMTIYDKTDTTIKILYVVKGSSTYELSLEKDSIFSLTGPLGKKSNLLNEEYKNKNILLIGIGSGISNIHFLAKTLNNKNIDIIYYIDNDFNDDPLLLSSLEKYANVKVSINLEEDIKKIKKYDVSLLIGEINILDKISNMLNKKNIKTYVSLSPLMLDGIGLCGSCRLTVGSSLKFACIDGPEFLSSEINFNEVMNRMNIYKKEEYEKIEMELGDKNE